MATVTMSMPTINVVAVHWVGGLGGQQRQQRHNRGQQRRQREIGRVHMRFFVGPAKPTLRGDFRRTTPTTTMTETIRDNEHDEDVMVQLMFGMLCPPEDEARPRSRRCCFRPKRQSLTTNAARAGGADPSRTTKRPQTGRRRQRRQQQRNMGYIGDDNDYTQHADNNITCSTIRKI